MLLFLLDIIIISVLILSFAAFVFLYLNPNYTVSLFKKDVVNQTCAVSTTEEEGGTGEEVYNVSPNVFTYAAAENVCKELKGTLASKKQLDDAFKNGANWCNYGWSKGQTAYYPTQASFYTELQKSPHLSGACGKIEVNGGYFKDPNLKFGVNCYGVKPPREKGDNQYANILEMVVPKDEIKKYGKTREAIAPFNIKQWSHTSPPDTTDIQS
jgi:hypothetical protein